MRNRWQNKEDASIICTHDVCSEEHSKSVCSLQLANVLSYKATAP